MAKSITSTGHVALYGIHFDTDKTDIKPESTPTLQEIAALLKQDPKLQLYVVGHTDSVGQYDYNVKLSERRAAAVVQALTYGAPDRSATTASSGYRHARARGTQRQ